ncbi:MAG TPA: transposase [Bacilli bacterium]|nr:transposase [Bacilli bacterium]
MATAEIAQLIEKMRGQHYSKKAISNIISSMIEDIMSFNKKRLTFRYAVVSIVMPLFLLFVVSPALHHWYYA